MMTLKLNSKLKHADSTRDFETLTLSGSGHTFNARDSTEVDKKSINWLHVHLNVIKQLILDQLSESTVMKKVDRDRNTFLTTVSRNFSEI